MRTKIFFLVLIFFVISCCKNTNKVLSPLKFQNETKNAEQLFVGDWYYESINNVDSINNKTFKINLLNNNTSITGYYCSVSRNGNKIDCFDETDKNINGFVKKDTLFIDFFSSWENSKGNAKLYFDNNSKLIWKLGKCEGENYLPMLAVLTREN